MKLKLISFKLCPFVHRVNVVTLAKGIEHEVEYIDITKKPEWFLNISPFGKVPVIVTEDGRALFESEAIIEYLEERYEPKLYPKDLVFKAQQRAWCYFIAAQYPLFFKTLSQSEQEAFELKEDKFIEQMSRVEETASSESNDFFYGNEPTMVDYALLPILYRAYVVNKLYNYDLLVRLPKLARIMDRMLQLKHVKESCPEGFENIFDSYLENKNSYILR